MPHQCLKCGNLFHEGSTTILRGCPECRGTRFFYTQAALGADERKRMLAGTEVSLREAIEDLVKKAKEGQVEAEEGDWVLAGPPPKPVIADPKIVPADLPPVTKIKVGDEQSVVVRLPSKLKRTKKARKSDLRWDYEAPPEPTAPPLFASSHAKPPEPAPVAVAPAPAIPAEPSAAPAPVAAPPAPEPLACVEPVAAAPVPLPQTAQSRLEDLASRAAHAAPEASPQGSGQAAPETIRIDAPGQYAIDVKALLEDSPVVIQKDGTYLIHLPSLFDSASKSRK